MEITKFTPPKIVKDEEVKEKDEIITSYIKAFNEIQDNLNDIKSKEKVITIHSQNIEWQQSNNRSVVILS